MKITVLKERSANENRVAITPDVVKKLTSSGVTVFIEEGAGENAFISDQKFKDAGAKVSNVLLELLGDANVVLKVHPSNCSNDDFSELEFMPEGSSIIGLLSPYNNKNLLLEYVRKKITSFSMELLPRITKAQSMDVLSSQSNLSGYMAVIKAASEYSRVFPMMTTAAGSVSPARVLILGAGVAGLQAIATAKRLGAIVSVFDVRTVAKEQVQSLGAKFIEVDSSEDGSSGAGYAKEMSEEYKKKQSALIHETLKKSDIVITTALIPGKTAPILITKEMIKDMKPGSVIADIAAASGGNCEGTINNQINIINGVKIIGCGNLASDVAAESSKLYAKNLYYFLEYLTNKEFKEISLNFEDEILKACTLTHNGQIVHPTFKV